MKAQTDIASKFANDKREMTTLTYDGYGNLQTSEAGSHPAINYSYDAIGRMTDLTDQVGSTSLIIRDTSLINNRDVSRIIIDWSEFYKNNNSDSCSSQGQPTPIDWTLWLIERRLWDWRTPPFTPYPPGLGDQGPGSTDPILYSPYGNDGAT